MAEQVKDAKAKAEAGTQAVATRPYDASKLMQVVGRIRKAKTKAEDAAMALATEWGSFEDKVPGISKGALKAAIKLHDMEQAKRYDYLVGMQRCADAFGTFDQAELDLDPNADKLGLPGPNPDPEPSHEKPIDMTGKLGKGKGKNKNKGGNGSEAAPAS